MMDPRPVKKDMLVGLVEIRVQEAEPFHGRQGNGGHKCQRSACDPFLVGVVRQKNLDTFLCYLPRRGRYAQLGEVRWDSGASLSVDINDEEYVFIYRDAAT